MRRETGIHTSSAGGGIVAPAAIAGGSLIAVVVLISTETGRYRCLGLLLSLFTSLKKNKVLDNFTRGMLMGYIIANPGTHMNAIRDRLAISNGDVAYHLMVLEREGFITSMNDGLKRRFYPGSRVEKREKGIELTIIQNLLISIMRKSPGITEIELAKLAGTSAQVVNYHTKRL